MKLIFTWDEYKQFAFESIKRLYPDMILNEPVFMEHGSYERDHDAYNFPPSYVEFEAEKEIA